MKYLNLLTVIFVMLKLLDLVDLTWWQVFIPSYLWGSIFILFGVTLLTVKLLYYRKFKEWLD